MDSGNPAHGKEAPRGLSLTLAIPLAVVLLLPSFLRQGDILADDSFISFRYAENLARHGELVFNPGERVEGYSNLAYTLLLSLGDLVGIPTCTASQLLGGLSGFCILLILLRWSGGSAGPLPGLAAAIATALSAPFVGWTFRGLETAPFTCLILVVALGLASSEDRLSLSTIATLAVIPLTRPEGIVYSLLLAALAPIPWSFRRKAFAAGGGAWIAQLLFRLLYYGTLLPNTYHAKMGRGAATSADGFRYAIAFAKESGPWLSALLILGIVAGCLARHQSERLLFGIVAAGLLFIVKSGGEGFPDYRFFYPILPALFLLAAGFPGRARIRPALFVLLVLLSPMSRSGRTGVARLTKTAAVRERVRYLFQLEQTPQSRLGRFLASRLGPDKLIALGDCGRIPYAAGCRVLDLAGLMNLHIAGLPGPRHGKVDLRYVIRQEPDAIVLHFLKPGRGNPPDTRLSSYPPFLDAYRLGAVFPYGTGAYYAFFRIPDAAPAPEGALDLLSRLPEAVRETDGPARIEAGYGYPSPSARTSDLPSTEGPEVKAVPKTDGAKLFYGQRPSARGATLEELKRLLDVPLPIRPVKQGPGLQTLERRFRRIATHSRHGIALRLDPGGKRASIGFTITEGLPRGARLETSIGPAPWLWRQRLSNAAAELRVRIEGKGFVIARSLVLDPSRRIEDRAFHQLRMEIPSTSHRFTISIAITRRSDPGDPLDILLSDPVVTLAGSSSHKGGRGRTRFLR